jgi:hypothetical protein
VWLLAIAPQSLITAKCSGTERKYKRENCQL